MRALSIGCLTTGRHGGVLSSHGDYHYHTCRISNRKASLTFYEVVHMDLYGDDT